MDVGTIAGVALLGGAAAGGVWVWAQRRQGGAAEAAPAAAAPAPDYVAPEATLPVQSAEELVQSLHLTDRLQRARAASELNEGTWLLHVQPVIDRVAELVQLLPASESHHHAQPGGLLEHLCETMDAALQLRRGVILPPNRQPDDVARLRHRWTVGLILAALLHDIGKPVSDVRVRLYARGLDAVPWRAMAGSMLDAGARAYSVEFPAPHERDYRAHQRLGALLMQRIVPAKTLSWIAEDGALMQSLMEYLGDEGPGAEGPLARLVRAGEAQSVSVNLRSGPRTRFASARAVPLIERLMAAMRRMLAEGSELPLNRPGAAGYVFEGEVWFAAARLANTVRDYLIAHESAAAVPGADKNDRFFDAWQDYGAVRPHPQTQRALWGGRIVFDQPPQSYELPAMLRFPVDLLFSPEHRPQPMPGRIVPMEAEGEPAEPGVHTGNTPAAVAHAVLTEDSVPAVKAESPSAARSPNVPREPVRSADTPVPPEPDPALSAPQPVHTADSPAEPKIAVAAPPPAPPAPEKTPAAYLDGDESAAAVALPARKSRPAKAERTPAPATLAPVAPAAKLPSGQPSKGTPTSAAIAFMAWLQRGIADGSLAYNTSGAVVHFVKYTDKIGVLLVSPSIFRIYAASEPEPDKKESDAPGQASQRALSNAGWHLRGPGGKNIWPYQVMRTGDRGGNLLNGFLILEPERFFEPVPPANDRLVLWASPAAAPGAASKAKPAPN